jgi:hypothetical protein
MAICSTFGVPGREVHLRQNLCDEALFAQDASIGEKAKFAGLLVKGHTPARMLLILVRVDDTSADEFCPIFIMITVVDQVVAVPNCF